MEAPVESVTTPSKLARYFWACNPAITAKRTMGCFVIIRKQIMAGSVSKNHVQPLQWKGGKEKTKRILGLAFDFSFASSLSTFGSCA